MEENRMYVRRIIMAVNVMEGLYEKGAQKNKTTDNMLYLLYALGDGKPHTQKSIHEEWLIPRTTLNTLVKKCEAEGYITLERVPGRRRDLAILLTEKGRRFEEQVMKDVYAAEKEAIARTFEMCGSSFIDGLECFSRNLRIAFENVENPGNKNN